MMQLYFINKAIVVEVRKSYQHIVTLIIGLKRDKLETALRPLYRLNYIIG